LETEGGEVAAASFRTRFFIAILAAAAFGCVIACAPAYAARRARAARASHETAAREAPPAIALSQIHVLGDRPAPFALEARAALLIDAKSGETLYAFNEHERIQPASLAKIMTFYITLERLHRGGIALGTLVPISEDAWRLSMNQSVSRMFLDVGSRVPVRQLLFGLMVSSGNDAAVALADYIAGSSDSFVKMMNDKCRELGLDETKFQSPDGLPMPDQYTTAADMVKLARLLVERYPDALTYTSTKEFTYHNIKQRNFNTLLFYDSRVDGLKTGHVEEAGYHLVATAKAPDGMELVSCVMGTRSAEKRRVETEKMIDWAFRTFATVSPDWHKSIPPALRVYGGTADSVAIAPPSMPYFTVDRADRDKFNVVGDLKAKYLVAPVLKGAQVGELTLMLDGKPHASIPVETQAAVTPGGFFKRVADRIRLKL
jgi:serine-type D-Ala-D-Ala carboxypeptidase (penicillin-binding protein 5/6)